MPTVQGESGKEILRPVAGTQEAAAELGIKLVPRGTFAGTIYQVGLLEDGELVACDTGEQGGGQN